MCWAESLLEFQTSDYNKYIAAGTLLLTPEYWIYKRCDCVSLFMSELSHFVDIAVGARDYHIHMSDGCFWF